MTARYELQRRSTGVADANLRGATGDWSAVPVAASEDAPSLILKARDLGAGEYRIVRVVQAFRVQTEATTVSKVERLDEPAKRKAKATT